jgi:hypothetical protein
MSSVALCSDLPEHALATLLGRHGMVIESVPMELPIPGSYWGDSEAGLIGHRLHLRADTPVHSALHEACHWLLADADRRAQMHTNAGGCDTEENAVCYLQCLLADQLPGYSQTRCFADMDAWGYHFILGRAAAWFKDDSEDAQRFLRARGWLPHSP